MFELGKFLGVSIKLHWSLAISSLMFTVSFYQLTDSVTSAVVLTFLFLLSILSHEYAHILTGRYFGVQSTKVIMFALGGAALLESKIKKPLHEFLIALAGPFWSFYLSVVFMMSFFMFGDIEALEQQLDFRSMDQLSAVFIITSLINFTLAVFNMVPAYPLDGGRVLHSALWKLFGLQKSNFASIMSGKVLGASFMIMGCLMCFGFYFPFFGSGIGSGMWLGILGFFLFSTTNIKDSEYGD
jgi:Zn-dependent protease